MINVGDVVMLKSGGPLLTVTHVEFNESVCIWFNENGVVQKEQFPIPSLLLKHSANSESANKLTEAISDYHIITHKEKDSIGRPHVINFENQLTETEVLQFLLSTVNPCDVIITNFPSKLRTVLSHNNNIYSSNFDSRSVRGKKSLDGKATVFFHSCNYLSTSGVNSILECLLPTGIDIHTIVHI